MWLLWVALSFFCSPGKSFSPSIRHNHRILVRRQLQELSPVGSPLTVDATALGNGSFGVVFEAWLGHPGDSSGRDANDRVVAKRAMGEDGERFLKRELAINVKLAESQSSFLAPFLGSLKQEGETWLVWRHCGVHTLADYLERPDLSLTALGHALGVSNPEDDLLVLREVLRQLLMGLRVLHQHHVIYRDVSRGACISLVLACASRGVPMMCVHSHPCADSFFNPAYR